MDLGEYGLVETIIELLKQKSLEGNLVFAENSRTGSDGTVVSYTPASGKNFVLVFASYHHTNSSASDTASLSLKNDVNTRQTHNIFILNTTISTPIKFDVFGDTLVGDGAKKYEISASGLNATSTVYGTICGYLEDT